MDEKNTFSGETYKNDRLKILQYKDDFNNIWSSEVQYAQGKLTILTRIISIQCVHTIASVLCNVYASASLNLVNIFINCHAIWIGCDVADFIFIVVSGMRMWMYRVRIHPESKIWKTYVNNINNNKNVLYIVL